MSYSNGVVIFSSEVAGSQVVKKQTTGLTQILNGHKIPFAIVDVSIDSEGQNFMHSKSGKRTLPQVFCNGEFKGGYEEIVDQNEDGAPALKKFLGL